MTAAVDKLIEEMADLVPPGQPALDLSSREELQRLTALLLDAGGSGADEYRRYRDIADRGLDIGGLDARLREIYGGKRILVTGGTGCIGSRLTRELMRYEPSAVFVIYALHDDFEPIPGVVYVHVDIADADGTRAAMGEARPDVVFHCAAQRSPWLAERTVRRTLRSNVVGTRNVLAGARDAGVERFVHASTGKAMRYYTADVYAASKKLAEWLVADYADAGAHAGLARFTHVVDNAVLLQRIDAELGRADGIVRVHDPETYFYAQSARESAQLLLLAGLTGEDGAEGAAIHELGEPANLLDLVIGRIATSPRPHDAALYVSGHERGYENGTPPGVYDPATALEVSPLINAIEAPHARPLEGTENVDRFPLAAIPVNADVDAVVDNLEDVTRNGTALDASTELVRAGRDLAEGTFDRCPEDLLTRLHHLATRAGGTLPTRRWPAPERAAS